MTKRIALAGAGLFGVLLLAGCGGKNGWDAIPVNGDSDDTDTCYQITEWVESDWFSGRQSWAKGIYCPAKITSTESE